MFGPARLVAIPIAVHRLGVDRVDGVPLVHQRRYEQPIRTLNGDLHRCRYCANVPQPLRQEVNSLDAVCNPERTEPLRLLIGHVNIVVLACPIHPYIYWHVRIAPWSPRLLPANAAPLRRPHHAGCPV